MVENKTNIEKADEVVGYIGMMGGIPSGKAAPYIGFLTSTPSALTSFGVLVDKINKGTAKRNDYVHALTSLGGVALATAELVALGILGTGLGIPAIAIGIGLAVLDYLDSKDYEYENVKKDYDAITLYLNRLLKELPKYNSLISSARKGLENQINEFINFFLYQNYTSTSSRQIRRIDPLVLDLNSDGVINSININSNGNNITHISSFTKNNFISSINNRIYRTILKDKIVI